MLLWDEADICPVVFCSVTSNSVIWLYFFLNIVSHQDVEDFAHRRVKCTRALLKICVHPYKSPQCAAHGGNDRSGVQHTV